MRRVPDLPALLGLARGDEDSAGYLHEGLIREICRKLRPQTELELIQQLYPGCDLADLEKDMVQTASVAFGKWKLEAKRP